VRELTIKGEMETSTTYDAVNDHYSRLAREMAQGHDEHSQKAALSFGYSADELSAIPEGSNLGVSCGNPIALAALKEASPFLFCVLVACNMC
jgi:arsenite methyltransferase